MPRVFKTTRGWYFISKYRKLKNNALWVGPFYSEAEAKFVLSQDPKEN